MKIVRFDANNMPLFWTGCGYEFTSDPRKAARLSCPGCEANQIASLVGGSVVEA